jgi:signal transduction histidine kinase
LNTTTKTVRLADFILQEMEPILQAWEDFAKTITPPALTMNRKELRDHASHMLKAVAIDIGSQQTDAEQVEKSKGGAPRGDEDTAAETHAAARLVSGYTVEQLVSEYRALRASVLKLWAQKVGTGLQTDPDDITRFNEAIDQALAESVARYAEMVKESQHLFLAILGHDLRTPLSTAIVAASAIMRADNIDSAYVLAATRIFTSGKRMEKLVNDLIDYTRTHLGSNLPIKPQPTSIGRICQAAVDEFRIVHPARRIEFKPTGELHGVWDEGRLAQVFSNLIGNAIQHGAKDSPIVISLQSSADRVNAVIHNDGKPIDPSKIQRIFQPLVRFNEHDQIDYSRDTSLGIGLYITQQIVRAHGGIIEVDSSEETGTNFRVCLPRVCKS